jgi:hypothetical protein
MRSLYDGFRNLFSVPQCLCVSLIAVALFWAPLAADDSSRLLSIDHFVRVKSTVPSINGQPSQVYVRERVLAGMVARATTAPIASCCSCTAQARRLKSPST